MIKRKKSLVSNIEKTLRREPPSEKLEAGVTLPTLKLEYTDATNWYALATENFVNSLVRNVNNLSSSTTSYSLLTTDATVVANNASASVNLTLPSAPAIGQQYTIIDGAGVSGTYPITILSPNTPVYQTGVSSFNPSVLSTLTGFSNPMGVAVTPNGNYTYIVNNGAGTVSVMQNTSSGSPTLLITLTGFNSPWGVAITPNGNYAYITNQGTGAISVIQNASSGAPSLLITLFATGTTPGGIAITPNGNYAYVTNNSTTTVSLITGISGSTSAIIGTNYGQITLIYNGTSWDATAVPASSSGGSSDTFQTLTFAANVTWNWAGGNIANITLTGNCVITPVTGVPSRGTLIVTQDSAGSRTLSLPDGTYRVGSNASQLTISTAPNSIDILQFQKDGAGKIYFWNQALGFVQIYTPPSPSFVYTTMFNNVTSVTQAQIQAWYDSFTNANPSPNVNNPGTTYTTLPIFPAGSIGNYKAQHIWLGSTTWYYSQSSPSVVPAQPWVGPMNNFGKGNFGDPIVCLARGI